MNFLWAILAASAAFCIAFVPLIQEKYRADGFALALWNKIIITLLVLPLALHAGFPHEIGFYILVAATGLLYSISDVIYFRAVPVVGAGVISRILPSSVIFTFLTWFIVKPSIWSDYRAMPLRAACILATILVAAFCAMQLKKCAISWRGIKLIWFVVFAAATGPILTKLSLYHASPHQGPYAYIVVQSFFMIAFWIIYGLVKKPITKATFLSKTSLTAGSMIGAINMVVLLLETKAMIYVDNPAYVTIVFFTDALWIIVIHRLLGRRDGSNIAAGLGLVGCAALLVFFKSL